MTTELEPQEGSDDKEQEKLNPISLPKGLTVDFILKTTKKWESSWQTFFNPDKERIRQYDRVWRSKVDKIESKKKISMPTAENVASTLIARLQQIFFPSAKLFDAQLEDVILPKDVEGIQKEIQLVEDFVNQKVYENKSLRREAEDFLIWCVVAGYGIAWHSWDTKERFKLEVDPKSETGVKEVKRTVGFWKWVSEPLFNVAWDPALKNKPLSDAGWVRRKVPKTLNELVKLEQEDFFGNVQEMIKQVGQQSEQEGDDDQQRIASLGDAAIQNERLWDVFEYYGDIAYKDDKGKIQIFEGHFFIAGGSWVLRAEVNPLKPRRKPVTMLRYKVRQGEAIGTSVYESIFDLLDEINLNKGKAGDITQRIANTPILVDSRSGIEGDNLWMATNGIIPVDSVDGTKAMPIAPGALEATRLALSDDIDTINGATPANEQTQGISGDAETATKTKSLLAAAGGKFQHLAQRGGSEFVGPLGQECYWFYRQFGEDGQMFTHTGGRDGLPVPVLRKNLMRDYDIFAITAETETDKAVRIKQLKEAAVDLAGLGAPEAAMKLYKDQILPLLGVPNPGDIMPDAAPQGEEPQGSEEIQGGTPASQELPAEVIPEVAT